MHFRLPTDLYQEDNCIINHSGQIASYGRRALIVTGHSSQTNGSLDDLCKALKTESISWELFSETEENPSLDQVMKVRDTYLESGIEMVIGLGGGSPMDLAKAVAVMLKNTDQPGSFLYEKRDHVDSLPVICIPTTCGTGSEVTGSAVLTLHDRHTKSSAVPKLFADLGLCDPKYLKSLPAGVLRNSAIDALSHLIESTVNSTSTSYSRLFSLEGLRLFGKCRKAIEEGRGSDQEYRDLMLMSTLGGFSIALTGTSLPHGASYPVTYNLKMAHGKACGYFQYGYLKLAEEDDRNLVLECTGFKSPEELRDYIVRVCQISKIDDEILEMSLRELLGNERKLRVCPFETSEEKIREMIYSIK